MVSFILIGVLKRSRTLDLDGGIDCGVDESKSVVFGLVQPDTRSLYRNLRRPSEAGRPIRVPFVTDLSRRMALIRVPINEVGTKLDRTLGLAVSV